MHRRILASTAAAVLALGLAACTDEGGGGTVTTPPPSINIDGGSGNGGDETTTPAPSDGGGDNGTAAPDIPAPDPADYPGMDQNTPEGAEQAFRYYIAVMVWGYQTGDFELLAELQAGDCNACSRNETTIEGLATQGRFWEGVEIEPVGTLFEETPDSIDVGYNFYLSEHTEPSESGDSKVTIPREEYGAVARMVWTDNQWKVDAMDLETAEAPS